jgi:hypothetical protein
MTTLADAGAASMTATPADHRRSPVPTFGMITSKFKELRKRRGLMVALTLVIVAIPTVFLLIRLLVHAFAPKTYGPAGGYVIYTSFVSGVLYTFGFIMAAALGATAGSSDLTEGVFRHLVVTGRSRLALYLARIPAGLAIIVPLVAVSFTIVCAVCVFAAPTRLSFNNVNVPVGLSRAGLESWAADHADEVICNFNLQIGPSSPIAPEVNAAPCNSGPLPPGAVVKHGPPGSSAPVTGNVVRPNQAQMRKAASTIAETDYAGYARQFLYPSNSLMINSGLWLELEALIGFLVALGLSSLIGQRTVTVIMMIIFEVVLTPIMSRVHLPHLLNLQRALVGLATAHLAPGGLPVLGGGGGGPAGGGGGNAALLPESTTVAVIVIVAWLVGWSILGAWRMMTRDA